MANTSITPPQSIANEALLEWERICGELAATTGSLSPSLRPLLILYVQAWEVNQICLEKMHQAGAVVMWNNGTAGPNPFFKTWLDAGKMASTLLAALGITGAKKVEGPVGAEDLEY